MLSRPIMRAGARLIADIAKRNPARLPRTCLYTPLSESSRARLSRLPQRNMTTSILHRNSGGWARLCRTYIFFVAEEARAKLKEQLSADDTHSIIKFLDFIIKHVRELGINEARNLVAAEIQAYRDRGAGSPIFTVDIEFPGNPPETLPVIAQCDFMSSDPSELERLKGSLRATREECRPRFSEYEIDKACGILDRVFSLVLRIDPQETRRKIHVRLSEEKEPGPISDSQAESMVAGNG